MVASKDPELDAPGPDDLYRVGVAGTVARMIKVPDGTLRILVQGGQRVRLADFVATEPYLVARIEEEPDIVEETTELEALTRNVQTTFSQIIEQVAVPARGAAGGGREPRRPRRALVHDRRRAADQDRGAPGAARGARPREAAAAPARAAHARVGADLARVADPVADPVRDGHRAARVLPAPAAQGDPGGARRDRRAGRPRPTSCASASSRPRCRRSCASRPSASCRASSGCRRRPPSTA